MSRNTCWSAIAALALLPWLGGCGAESPEDVASHGSDDVHGSHDDHGSHGEAAVDATHASHGETHEDSHGGHGSHESHGQTHTEDAHGGHGSHEAHGSSHGSSHGSDSHAEAPLAQANRRPVNIEAKIKIKNGEGQTAYSIKWKEDGAKLVDANEKEVARYNVSNHGAKLKIKDPDDHVLGYLVGAYDEGRIKVEDPSQEVELMKLIRQDDGDWKLEDANEKLLVRIKKRDYGVELEDASDQRIYKVKFSDGKTSLRDRAEKTKFYTNSPVRPASFACLGLDAIKDVRIRAALLVQMQNVHRAHVEH